MTNNSNLTRQQMQHHTIAIKGLLDAVIGLDLIDDRNNVSTLLDLAHDLTSKLDNALDAVNEGAAQ